MREAEAVSVITMTHENKPFAKAQLFLQKFEYTLKVLRITKAQHNNTLFRINHYYICNVTCQMSMLFSFICGDLNHTNN